MIYPPNEFLDIFKKTNGALSVSEAVCIMNIAEQAPEGIYIELGAHKGKSAMSALVGLQKGAFYLVDPIFKEKNVFEEVCDTFKDLSFKKANIQLLANLSTEVIEPMFSVHHSYNGYAYVFVDSGSHGDGLPMQEAKLLEDRMVQGGIIAWHDYKNQFVEVEQAYNYLLSTGKYEKIEIDWQPIFDYVAEHNLEENNNSWHLYPELPHPPNFVGALRRL